MAGEVCGWPPTPRVRFKYRRLRSFLTSHVQTSCRPSGTANPGGHLALGAPLRTLPSGTEGSLLRWEPQPHAAAPYTPYNSLLGASFKPDLAGCACIVSGRQVVQTQTMVKVACQKRGHCVHWSRPPELFPGPNPLPQLPAYIHTFCGAAGLRPPAAGWEAVATAPGASPRRGLLRPHVSPGCHPTLFARHPPFRTLGPTLRTSCIPEP